MQAFLSVKGMNGTPFRGQEEERLVSDSSSKVGMKLQMIRVRRTHFVKGTALYF